MKNKEFRYYEDAFNDKFHIKEFIIHNLLFKWAMGILFDESNFL